MSGLRRPALTSGARIETNHDYSRPQGGRGRPALTSGARIETLPIENCRPLSIVAPLSRAGRGLKLVVYAVPRHSRERRPALTSGARIETLRARGVLTSKVVAPLSRAGRGLKLFQSRLSVSLSGRPALTSGARIETCFTLGEKRGNNVAPLSRAGRGLKPPWSHHENDGILSPRSHERGAD